MRKVVWKRWNTLVFYASLLGSMAQCLGTLIYSLPAEQKKEVRELEKVSLKLAKSECSLLFNSVCLSENILPNYTNIYIYIYIYIYIPNIYTSRKNMHKKNFTNISVKRVIRESLTGISV